MKIVCGKRMCYDRVVRDFVRLDRYPHEAFSQIAKWLQDNVPNGEWYIESVRVNDWRSKYTTFRNVDENLDHLATYDENHELYHPNMSSTEIFYFDDENMALQFKLVWAGLIDN